MSLIKQGLFGKGWLESSGLGLWVSLLPASFARQAALRRFPVHDHRAWQQVEALGRLAERDWFRKEWLAAEIGFKENWVRTTCDAPCFQKGLT